MGLLDMLLDSQNSGAISQIARQAGVNESDARRALEHLSPALSQGLQRNIGTEGGLGSLLSALQSGNHGRYLDDPGHLANAVDDGNGILGNIFGSKDVSRGVADHVSQQTGIGSDLIRKMLPLVASLVMGALAKNLMGGGATAQAQASGGGLGGVLGNVLGGGQPQAGGGGLGDILGGVLSGGQPQAGGGGLGGILGSVLGAGQAQAGGGGLGGILSSMLDSGGRGSAFDDILNMATKSMR